MNFLKYQSGDIAMRFGIPGLIKVNSPILPILTLKFVAMITSLETSGKRVKSATYDQIPTTTTASIKSSSLLFELVPSAAYLKKHLMFLFFRKTCFNVSDFKIYVFTTMVCRAVFGSASEVVRADGSHVSGAVQDSVEPAAGQHRARDARLHQAGARPGGGPPVSKPRVQAAVHRGRSPGSRRRAAAAPARLRAQTGEVRRRPVHRTSQRRHPTRAATGYDTIRYITKLEIRGKAQLVARTYARKAQELQDQSSPNF